MISSSLRKFFIWLYIVLCAAIVFSLLCMSFSFDISLAALPLSLIFSGVMVYYSFMLGRKDDIRAIPVIRKMMQYLPYVMLASFVLRRAGKYGTYYWYDVLTVVLWCMVFIGSLAVSYYMNEKRIKLLKKEWALEEKKNPHRKLHGGAWVLFEVVDWIDALVQAVFMVLLIQIFIVQLYVIPSESMVPQFLIKDRVIVFKTASGPKFPLSNVGIPGLRSYKRGDIVVFRNPHYSMDRKSEVKTVTSQLVYMLTFMAVNLNKDADGEPKADPLVKRVAGVPGEQLVMQDGTLYARTKNSSGFKPVTKDASFAAWNLNSVDASSKRNIKTFPLSQSQYDMMLSCEKDRRDFNLNDAAAECTDLSRQFYKLVPEKNGRMSSDGISMFEYDLFVNYDSFTQKLMSADGGAWWFEQFMTDWIKDKPADGIYAGGDIYRDANYRLNVMIKLCLGRIIQRNAELIHKGITAENRRNDAQLYKYMEQAEQLNFYVMILDQRNMPVFPENNPDGSAQYIPDNCYFMMGDNRFNSLDMRHSYIQTMTPLTKLDNYSVTYESIMAPQFVNKKYILGTTVFRFWPVNRIGTLKS
ncbi:MAG: signal peptidase I [Treponema sp.]|nr:signal peptidase I [Treponema sp.]